MRWSLLLCPAFLVAACGGVVAPVSSERVPDETPTAREAPRRDVPSSSSGSHSSRDGEDDAADDEETQGGTCALTGAPITQTVTFHVTNTGTSTRWIATRGNWCTTIDIARSGATVPQDPGFQCVCECPNPGVARVQELRKLEPGTSIDLPWFARTLAQCAEKVDCGGMGQQTRWLSVAQPLTAGPLSARIAFETTLPQGCTESDGTATCQTMTGWPDIVPSSPVAGFCSASKSAAVDFVLPSTGDITVDVVVP